MIRGLAIFVGERSDHLVLLKDVLGRECRLRSIGNTWPEEPDELRSRGRAKPGADA